jgi:3,4-dihydroxy 2-butanone 4-phosphate synthase/GTP cyclohydrolase II
MENKVKEILRELLAGKPILIVDDSQSHFTSAIVCLASHANADMINFMTKQAKGIISIALSGEMAKQAGLSLQATRSPNEGLQSHRMYTESIDAVETTTGISAYERSLSIQKLARTCSANGFKKPGHIFPVVYAAGGLYEKISVVEAAGEIVRLSNQDDMAVLCDVLDEKGEMASILYTQQLSFKWNIPILPLSDLIRARLLQDGFLVSKRSKKIEVDRCLINVVSYQVGNEYYQIALNQHLIAQGKYELMDLHQKLWKSLLEGNTFSWHESCFFESFTEAVEQLTNGKRAIAFFDAIRFQRPPFFLHNVYRMIIDDIKTEGKFPFYHQEKFDERVYKMP